MREKKREREGMRGRIIMECDGFGYLYDILVEHFKFLGNWRACRLGRIRCKNVIFCSSGTLFGLVFCKQKYFSEESHIFGTTTFLKDLEVHDLILFAFEGHRMLQRKFIILNFLHLPRASWTFASIHILLRLSSAPPPFINTNSDLLPQEFPGFQKQYGRLEGHGQTWVVSRCKFSKTFVFDVYDFR